MDVRIARAAALTGVVVMALGLPRVAALGDTWPGPDVARPDSRVHDFCRYSSMDQGYERDAMEYGMIQMSSTTDMQRLGELCGTYTDLKWTSIALPGTLRGQWECIRWGGSITCDSGKISLDFAELNKGSYDTADAQKTALHEVGHSLAGDLAPVWGHPETVADLKSTLSRASN